MSNELTKQEDRIKTLVNAPQVKQRFEEMLGKKAPSFLSSIISAVNSNKLLKEADPMSVISAAAIAASMDLPINPSLGFAHIVPYKGSAQFQLGWKGFVQLAMRTGQYKTINLTPVLEGQVKKHNQFTGEMELQSEATSTKQAGFLLYFKLLNGYEKFFFMTRDECQAHGKRYSSSYQKGFGPWVDNFEAMALKTVCKAGLSRYGILSLDMQRAFEFDQAEVGPNGTLTYVDSTRDVNQPDQTKEEAPSKSKTKPAKLAAAIKEKKQQDQPKELKNYAPSMTPQQEAPMPESEEAVL